MKDMYNVTIKCDNCGEKIDIVSTQFRLKFIEPDPTYGRDHHVEFDFCSPACLSIYTLNHFKKMGDVIKFKRDGI